jgi:hypothetical protein
MRKKNSSTSTSVLIKAVSQISVHNSSFKNASPEDKAYKKGFEEAKAKAIAIISTVPIPKPAPVVKETKAES